MAYLALDENGNLVASSGFKKQTTSSNKTSNKTTKVKEDTVSSYYPNQSSYKLPSALDISKQKYNTYNDALTNVSTFSDEEINSAYKEANKQANYYKNKVYGLAKEADIQTSNNKDIVKSQGEYRGDSIKERYNNIKSYNLNNKPTSASEMAEESDKKYNENKDKFNKIVKTNDKYKEYEDYAYRAAPLLEQTKNQREVTNKKTTFLDKVFAPFTGGVSEGLNNTFLPTADTYKLANGEIVRNNTKAGIKGQKVMSEADSLFGKVYSSASYSLGNMAPSIAAGTINPAVGAVVMGGNTYNNAYNESLKEGYTPEQANRYATANTTLELGLGKALGGMTTILGKSGLNEVISKSLSKVISSQATRNLLAEIGSEFTEEYLQEIIDPVVRNITLGENNKFKPFSKDALIAGISGALNAGISNYPKFSYDSNREKIYTKENVINIINNQSQNNVENSIVNSAVNNAINENNINLPKINDKIINNLSKNGNFSEQIDKFVSGNLKNSDYLYLGNTPKKLQEIGLNNNPIILKQSKLKSMIENGPIDSNSHNLTADLIKKIPASLENPLNVLKSSTQENSVVIITDLADVNENPIIASIALDDKGQIGNIEFLSNRLSSAYGKLNYDAFMKNEISKGNLLYDIDEGIIKRSDGKLQLRPTTSNKELPTSTRLQLSEGLNSSINNDTTTNLENQVTPLPIKDNIQKSANNTDDINIPIKNNLTSSEQTELAELQNLPFDLDKKQQSRLDYLMNKQQGKQEKLNIKLPELKQVKATEIENKVKKTLQTRTYKAVNEATNTAQQYINFDKIEKKNFKEELMKFSSKSKNELQNAKTYQDVKEIIKKYADREVTFVNEELATIKNEIKSYKIKVDDYIKSNMDYNTFRKQNFGKLKLGNDGISIDSAWQELSNLYPQYFNKNIVNEFDMLNNLSDFMNQSFKITENYMLSDSEINNATNRVFDKLLNNSLNNDEIDSLQAYLEDKYNIRTRAMVQQELLDEMNIKIEDLDIGKDIGSIAYQRTDPIRLNEKVFGSRIGQKINDATINQTKHNEAERIRFLNKERSEIEELGIKPRSKESAAVQKYGEGYFIDDYGKKIKYTLEDLKAEFPNVDTQTNIVKASNLIRSKYDIYLDEMNEVITSLGYDAIPKRKDYMHHFQELDSKLAEWGLPLSNLNDENLPTDINGLTDQFKPEKNYFAAAMERKGMKTTYDAITGIDGYLEGVSNLIYHTKDIQRYRALSKLIRETYGQTHGLDNMNKFTSEQFNQRLEDIYNGKLSKYVAWLDEQANALAGKKGAIDRGAERILGRKIYTVLDTAKKQVGSNMTGFNVRSSLTNFASAIQGASKTNKIAFLKGTISTFKNIIHNDGLIDKSDFLTSRFGSNQLSQKIWQKASNAGQILMSGSDYFTSNQIWRSKYYENLQKGMNEKQAIKNADDFSARIMGDRSKGTTAEIFNSKTLGLLTQFQLEVNNQWSSMIHDNKIEIANGNKTKTAVLFQLGQLAAASYLFNNLMKSLTGSSVMFDPIDMLKKLIGVDDDDKDKSLDERTFEVLGDLIDNLPMASIFTGGRIPMSEAFTGVTTAFKKATNQTDEYGNKITYKAVGKDIISSAFYWLLPTGYGQIKKTVNGASMYDTKLPLPGSYTNSGNLRFNADESVSGKIKAVLFGQYSSEEAQKYIDSGYKSINKNNIEEMKKLEMNASEYRDYRSGLAEAGKKVVDKADYINDLNIDTSKKNIMLSNILYNDTTKGKLEAVNNLNMSEIDKNKYFTAQAKISEINSDKNNNNKKKDISDIIINSNLSDKDMAHLYSNYYSNEEKLNYILSLKIPIKEYIKLNSEDIAGDYDTKTGKTISGSKKAKVINYVNSLKLSVPQKAILIKSQYSTYKSYDNQIINYVNNLNTTANEKKVLLKSIGFDNYNKDVVNYINSQNLTTKEKEEKLKSLGFTIRNGKVYW